MAANTKVAAVLGVDTSQAPAEPGNAMSADVSGKKTTTRNISVREPFSSKEPKDMCREASTALIQFSTLTAVEQLGGCPGTIGLTKKREPAFKCGCCPTKDGVKISAPSNNG